MQDVCCFKNVVNPANNFLLHDMTKLSQRDKKKKQLLYGKKADFF